jgi:hypothetical protein
MDLSPGKRDETSPRPITFRAAENLGAFELAQLWADRTAWPIDDRTHYDELSELAVMSALGAWLRRWQPVAIHSAMLAGARPEAIQGALGNILQVAFERWHEWALHQRDLIVGGEARHHDRRVRGGCAGIRVCWSQASGAVNPIAVFPNWPVPMHTRLEGARVVPLGSVDTFGARRR